MTYLAVGECVLSGACTEGVWALPPTSCLTLQQALCRAHSPGSLVCVSPDLSPLGRDNKTIRAENTFLLEGSLPASLTAAPSPWLRG